MVRTEADMIVIHINHHHIIHHQIIHHQGIIYIFNLQNFPIKKNCEVSSITTMMIMKMDRCSMVGKRGSLILALVGEANFRTLTGETGFLILFLLLMGVLMLSQSTFDR